MHPRKAGSRRILAAIESWQGLTRQRQRCRLMPQLQDEAIGLDDFVGVSGPNRSESRYGAQRYQMLDWLVSWAIFAVAHGFMREYEK
jgi:hypothetical protein